MTATTNAKGVNLTVLDTAIATGYSGVPYLTAGEGAGGRLIVIEDAFDMTTAFNVNGSWFRFLRFPSRAKIKKLEISSDGVIDNTSTTATMKLDFGVMFSDGNDGTAPAYKSLVPKNAADGTTVATPVTANMNDVFYSAGSVVNFGAGAQKAIPWTDITYTNAAAGLTTAPTLLTAMQTPVINLFNFASNGQA